MDAISGRAWYVVDAGLCFEHAQGYIEGQRIAGTTAVTVGGHDGHRHVGERREGLPQAANAFRAEAVVVAYQYLHRGVYGGVEAREAATILEALSAEVA